MNPASYSSAFQLSARPPVPSPRLRILLVEDDEIDRLALRRFLVERKLPYDLDEAGSVAEAGHKLAAGRYDLLLLDHNLPDGTGFDLFGAAAGTPIVFVTGNNDLEQASCALDRGAADYLVKDIARHYLKVLPFAVTRAVHERRRETELRASQAQLSKLLDCLPVAAFACDAQGVFTYCNPRTKDLWGRSPRLNDPTERFCTSIQLFELDGKRITLDQSLRVLLKDRGQEGRELLAEFPGGRRRDVLAYASPIHDATGALDGAINLWLDVTEMRRLAEHKRSLEAQLSQARKLEAVGTLAGGVAHEFNNLLTSILGNLQLAELESAPESPVTPRIQAAVDSSRRARDMVRRLLDFAQQSEGGEGLQSLEEMILAAERLLRPGLPAGVGLEIDLEAGCPPVRGDAHALREALLQLVANSLYAMRPQGGRLELTLRHAVPAAEFRARHPQVGPHHTVCLSVQDTGTGMSAAVLARIFEPFYTTKPPGAGSGLGLAGVFGLMKRHDGAIVVESEPGAGTTVRLFFPPADRAAPAPGLGLDSSGAGI